jgi:hypothetical protein
MTYIGGDDAAVHGTSLARGRGAPERLALGKPQVVQALLNILRPG